MTDEQPTKFKFTIYEEEQKSIDFWRAKCRVHEEETKKALNQLAKVSCKHTDLNTKLVLANNEVEMLSNEVDALEIDKESISEELEKMQQMIAGLLNNHLKDHLRTSGGMLTPYRSRLPHQDRAKP